MKLFYRLIVIFILVFTLYKPAYSTHVVGGELIYRCLDPQIGFYRFTLKLYRDCYTGVPPFDDPIYLSIYDSLENLLIQFNIAVPPTDTLENNTYNLCLFSPPNVCVEEATYIVDQILLPGKYYITYQRCCRNQGIVNIINPESVGAGWDITIPEPSKAICNSSPFYNNYPPTIICVDDTFKYDHSATDPDGDSLVYYLCTPNNYNVSTYGVTPRPSLNPKGPGPPSSNFDVPYVPPYDSAYPIWTVPTDTSISEYPFQIDPQTGFLSGLPTQIGRYVVGVCASEYRNGVLLSTNKRDFQFNVAQCVADVYSAFTAAPPDCDDLTMSFTNTSNQATFYYWDFGIDSLGTGTDTSTVQHPTFTYPDYGNYNVAMVVNPGLSCADTSLFNVYLYDSPIADAGEDALISLGESVIIGGDTTASGGTPPYTYLWTPDNSLDDPTLANPIASPSDTLSNSYTITVTDSNGCQNIDVDTVVIRAIDSRVVIPSAFTPNNDGRNDTLFLIGLGIKDLLEFKIFNRWGELVFETQDIKQGWDGKFKKEPQEIGRYVYFYIAETLLGDKREGKGDVALLR